MPIQAEFVPVESQTITDHAYEQLRQAIHVGKLKPGQRLIDTELAEALQVSRATVREALRMLASKGLVEIRHRRGAFVAESTPHDLRDACAFRALLETHAIRLGAQSATPDELAALQQLIERLHDAAAQRDFEQIVDLDLRFHLALCHFAHSKRLLDAWCGMETMLRAFLLLKYALYDDSALIAGSHQPILDALQQHDADRAAPLLRAHILDTAERVLEGLELEQQRAATQHA
jgi:DNA-binding GntR family transcriptional regulator